MSSCGLTNANYLIGSVSWDGLRKKAGPMNHIVRTRHNRWTVSSLRRALPWIWQKHCSLLRELHGGWKAWYGLTQSRWMCQLSSPTGGPGYAELAKLLCWDLHMSLIVAAQSSDGKASKTTWLFKANLWSWRFDLASEDFVLYNKSIASESVDTEQSHFLNISNLAPNTIY